MAFNKDSTVGTLTVALIVCLICGVIVATAAISLRPKQELNRKLDQQANILKAVGLYDASVPVAEQFRQVKTRYVDFATGEYVEQEEGYDQYAATSDTSTSIALTAGQDIAGIRRRANVGVIYQAVNDAGEVIAIALPVQGYGLWSTMYGFLSLESDANTIKGLVFYAHGETPGLGGEIDNPNWQALWAGKKLRDENGELLFQVVKGSVDPSAAGAEYRVDGLSGATLTSQGVSNTIAFWTGENGFGPYLLSLQADDEVEESGYPAPDDVQAGSDLIEEGTL